VPSFEEDQVYPPDRVERVRQALQQNTQMKNRNTQGRQPAQSIDFNEPLI